MKKVFIMTFMIFMGVTLYGKAESESLKLPGLLVDTEWLSGNLGEGIVIIDTARPKEDYISSHVPGAFYLEKESYRAEVNGIPAMLPAVPSVVELLENLGISNDTPVVIYDSGVGIWAARMAWTMAYLGHENWAVLDGGYASWQADGYEIQSEIPQKLARGSFEPNIQKQLLISGSELAASLDDHVVVDTRSKEEYTGENALSKRGGHIPGSLWIEWTMNNTESDTPTLLDGSELAEFYSAQGVTANDSVVTLCQTGVRGAHTWLALTLAGYENVALYDGSWTEWGNNDNFEVEK